MSASNNAHDRNVQPFLPFDNLPDESASPLPIGEKQSPSNDDDDHRKIRLRQLLITGLMFYRHQISENTKAISHELASDSPAFYSAFKTAATGDVISSGVALLIVGMMGRQRQKVSREFKETLTIWAEYQRNRRKISIAETYDALETRLRESGIIFENLPKQELMSFKAAEYDHYALQYLGKSDQDHTKERTKPSLRSIWNTVKSGGINGSQFIGHFVGDFVENIFHLDELPKKFWQASISCVNTASKYNLLTNTTRQRHKIIQDAEIDAALDRSNQKGALITAAENNPELFDEVVNTRASVIDFIGQDKEAAALLVLQTLFISAQVATCAANFLKGDSNSAAINLVCINAATVAWRVLAENKLQLEQALESRRSILAQRFSILMGIESKETTQPANDNHQDAPAAAPALER
jgi:hypothetical protein